MKKIMLVIALGTIAAATPLWASAPGKASHDGTAQATCSPRPGFVYSWGKGKWQQHSPIDRARFLTIGGGIAPLHGTWQPGMSPVAMPMDVFLATGKKHSPLSYALAYNTLGAYEEPLFELRSSHFSLQVHYRFWESQRWSAYGFGGISYWQAYLKLKPYPGIENYAHKTEEDSGAGLVGGVGVSYAPLPKLTVGARATAFAGQAAFLAGGFEGQPVQTGSIQTSIYLAYTFSFGKSRIQCPVF